MCIPFSTKAFRLDGLFSAAANGSAWIGFNPPEVEHRLGDG
jgi:hypothetical protein